MKQDLSALVGRQAIARARRRANWFQYLSALCDRVAPDGIQTYRHHFHYFSFSIRNVHINIKKTAENLDCAPLSDLILFAQTGRAIKINISVLARLFGQGIVLCSWICIDYRISLAVSAKSLQLTQTLRSSSHLEITWFWFKGISLLDHALVSVVFAESLS